MRASAGGRVWWIAPVFAQANEGWTLIKAFARQLRGVTIRESDRLAEWADGGSVQVKTADNPHTLRGAGLDFVVLDECAYMKPETWHEVIRPALADRQGSALFISTPSGRNWFFDLYRKGEEGEPGWASFQFPTSANPHIAESELHEAERELPEAVFRQEFLAEFVDEEGLVFRCVREAATLSPSQPAAGVEYFVFADLASTFDFNAVAVVRRVGQDVEQVHVDRWNRVPVEDTLARLRAVGEGFRGRRAIDATGLGGEFAHEWLGQQRWDGVKFTNENKTGMVRHLQALLEHRRVRIINPDASPAAKAQYHELLDFTAVKLPSGGYRYEAPSGRHDDTVTALMGACWLAKGAIYGRVSDDPLARAWAL